mgnify:CR=1 FL=1
MNLNLCLSTFDTVNYWLDMIITQSLAKGTMKEMRCEIVINTANFHINR